ncbi:DUF1835 domain-containing protein [Rummeliibacillus sp. NPDC094406]|uniref:DUF1835 domain-containing protein n=1 Tax=Rummeliibacillus sp. NPDC094406 TaxID=3364511 RepID=UPI0038225455
MIHIVFSASVLGSLQVALREMGLDKTQKVISFWDMFSIGPVWQLHEENGINTRFEWMSNCIRYEYDEFTDYKHKFGMTLNQINIVPEGVHVFIWCADNAQEQTGIRYVMYLLRGKNINITLINTTQVYEELFHVENVKYTLLHTGEIPPEKLQIIYEQDYGKLITDSKRKELEKEWLTLSDTNATLRIWRDGKIQSVPEEIYDDFIIKRAKKLHNEQITKDYMKSARLIGEVLGHLEQYVGDGFLEYRLRKLIENGIFEMVGNLKGMRYYSVKLL